MRLRCICRRWTPSSAAPKTTTRRRRRRDLVHGGRDGFAGIVAHGDKRGRELGFPTANVSVPGDILLPADGIYAGWFQRADGTVTVVDLPGGRVTSTFKM